VVVADGTAGTAVSTDPRTAVLLAEMFRHGKAIAAVGDGRTVLDDARVDAGAPGVTVADSSDALVGTLREALGLHRSWDRLAALAGL
jgi:catalase